VSPNVADAELAVGFLRAAGVEAKAFPGLRELAFGLDEDAGCLILVEEALIAEDLPALREALERLPPWSDVPLIVVARDVRALGEVMASAFPTSGNVTLLERPLNPHTLASSVLVALRATARQREVGDLLAQREQAVKARDEFLAMLAHELRNPLAPMRNALYLMRTMQIDEPAVVKSAAIIDRQVTHMVRMVDDLMDVARLERGKVVLQKARADLNHVASAAIESCLPGAQGRGQRISVRFGADALPVDADTVRVEQIVCNLVNNAIKFSPPAAEIVVETGAAEGAAFVAVADQGIGFDPEAGGRLFDPFVQVSATVERSTGGLGMGLTIVRRLVELHGGSVSGESAGPGRGSRFVVRIPLATGEAPALPPEAAAVPARARSIVLVEDNPDIRNTFETLVRLWGHEVAMAPDGPSGVELIVERRPDIALVDVGLPGMNGYEVARAVRKAVPNGGLRLIALTGYGQPSDREQAMAAGFDAHLLKPLTPEALQRLLAE
jgi:signal transduction histidine kinase